MMVTLIIHQGTEGMEGKSGVEIISLNHLLTFQDMLDYKSKVRHLKIKFMDGSVKTLQVKTVCLQAVFFFCKALSMFFACIVHNFYIYSSVK